MNLLNQGIWKFSCQIREKSGNLKNRGENQGVSSWRDIVEYLDCVISWSLRMMLCMVSLCCAPCIVSMMWTFCTLYYLYYHILILQLVFDNGCIFLVQEFLSWSSVTGDFLRMCTVTFACYQMIPYLGLINFTQMYSKSLLPPPQSGHIPAIPGYVLGLMGLPPCSQLRPRHRYQEVCRGVEVGTHPVNGLIKCSCHLMLCIHDWVNVCCLSDTWFVLIGFNRAVEFAYSDEGLGWLDRTCMTLWRRCPWWCNNTE